MSLVIQQGNGFFFFHGGDKFQEREKLISLLEAQAWKWHLWSIVSAKASHKASPDSKVGKYGFYLLTGGVAKGMNTGKDKRPCLLLQSTTAIN